MSYQVFARKYRPKTFADVLGQDHVVRTLRNAIAQSRLAHAYLFVGPRGTGKTSTARIFAKALNCPGGPSIEFDPNDPVCIEIAEGRCLDVQEIDGASNNGVEEVRKLRESVNFAPASCRYKIYYIDEVHMLTTAAFNALLKTLEEPPEHVKFIFATTEANKILPTIISRCQRFDLRRIPDTVIAEHLLYIAKNEGVDLDEKAAYAIARGADGGMRDAQSMLDQLVAFCGDKIVEPDVLQVFGFTAQEAVADLCDAILTRSTAVALKVVHEQSEAGKDLGRLLGDLIQHVRRLLVSQSDLEGMEEDMSPEMLQRIKTQAAQATGEQLLRVVDGLAEVDARMRWSSNKRLHLELGVIQAVESMAEVSLSDVINAIDKAGGTAGEAASLVQARRASVPTELPKSVALAAPFGKEPEPPAPETAFAEAEDTPALLSEPEVAESVPAEISDDDLWTKIVTELKRSRPLIANWARTGTQLALDGNTLTIGFPPSEAGSKDSLLRPNTRNGIEGMLKDLTGKRMQLDLVIDDTLVVPVQDAEPETIAAPVVEKSSTPTEQPPAATTVDVPSNDSSSSDSFYQDPLIDAVLVQLEARIVGRTFGNQASGK
ncbi:MAG: DNA polymerase III subunit gamma/tau [Verrucomicrobiaceae bacterium]|nr:DNA polymerase III subunit gamma/tau [Verrucomicrobiaceae bacterium]